MNSQKIMLTKYSLAKVPIFENNTFCNRILVYNIKRHPNSMMIFWIKCYFVIKENITNYVKKRFIDNMCLFLAFF